MQNSQDIFDDKSEDGAFDKIEKLMDVTAEEKKAEERKELDKLIRFANEMIKNDKENKNKS